MTFISYAQNFEDVMLWRALRHVENGFYIDVGAGHPDDYSVTRAFYDRGWRGINIEPTNRIVRLAGARPRDINLQVAVGHTADELTLFVVEDNKDISTLDPAIAEDHRTSGWTIGESSVSVVALADVCQAHVRCDINFLKIDVEGAERDVLLGADFGRFRPWIAVIEATVPNSEVPTYAAWEELLTNAGYRFVWFDGLNRFYIAGERWEQLAAAFVAPPNVFDDFVRPADTEHFNRILGVESRAAALEARLVVANRMAEEAAQRAMRAEHAAAETESLTLQAQEQAALAEARAQAAEARAQVAEERVQQARAIEERAAAAWRRTAIAEAKTAQTEAEAAQAKAAEDAALDWLQAMRTSTSWKLTKPLRELGSLLHRRGRSDVEATEPNARQTPPEPVAAPPAAFSRTTVPVQAFTDDTCCKRRTCLATSTAPDGRGRILLDLSTSLAWRDAHAVGIVRTERELGARLLNDPELTVLPVVFHGGALRLLDDDFARSILTVGLPEPLSATSGPTAAVSVQAAFQRPLRARMIAPAAWALRGCVRIALRAIPEPKRSVARQLLIQARQVIREQIYTPTGTARGSESRESAAALFSQSREAPDLSLVVYPRQNDVLFCAGLGWDVIDWGLIEALRHACNLRVVSVLYDLIPIKFPDMIPQSTDHYVNYFLHLLDECDLAFCISASSQRDFIEFAAAMGRRKPATEILRLGANVPAAPRPDEFSYPNLRDRLRRGRFALTVGTFEVRKNYRLLIDLWHELAVDHTFDLDLVIVGMAGWGVEETLQQLRASPLLGSRIFWLQGVSDAGLSWLYETCHLLLYPSLYEGWGLPIVEALQRKRPVIASNRGAVPEAALGAATIIDPDDRSAWRNAIIAEALTARRQVLVRDIPTWDDASQAVRHRLSDLVSQTEIRV